MNQKELKELFMKEMAKKAALSINPKSVVFKLDEMEKLNLSSVVAALVVDDYEEEGKAMSEEELNAIARTCSAFTHVLHQKCEVYTNLDLYLDIKTMQNRKDDEESEVTPDDIKN